jgi:hypothetical protein
MNEARRKTQVSGEIEKAENTEGKRKLLQANKMVTGETPERRDER